jgi:hypothetical protein
MLSLFLLFLMKFETLELGVATAMGSLFLFRHARCVGERMHNVGKGNQKQSFPVWPLEQIKIPFLDVLESKRRRTLVPMSSHSSKVFLQRVVLNRIRL